MEQDQHPSPQQGPSEIVPRAARAAGRRAREPPAAGRDHEPKLPRTRPQRVTERRRREQAREPATRAPPRPCARRRLNPPRPGGPASGRRHASRPRGRDPLQAAGVVGHRRQAESIGDGRQDARERGFAAQAPRRGKPAAARRATAPGARAGGAGAAGPGQARRPAPSAGNGAPSLPRLAVDGAVEAAKLPLRVGGRLTLRALDAVARGLRGG